MVDNGAGIGRETALFAFAFFIGYLVAAQKHEEEVVRLRDATKTARQQTIHLMALMRGSNDESEG